MGAIAGVWQHDVAALDPHQVDRLVTSLTYRQPQPYGVYCDPATPLALVGRLRERGQVPPTAELASYAAGRYWLAFDGVLENRAELQVELATRGAVFPTGSDAEAVLAAYAEWGE